MPVPKKLKQRAMAEAQSASQPSDADLGDSVNPSSAQNVEVCTSAVTQSHSAFKANTSRVSISTPDPKKLSKLHCSTPVVANVESDVSNATDGSYDADIESGPSVVSTSDKSSVLSLSSAGSNMQYLHEALDKQELASEPSDSSVVANLIEAIEVLNDHSSYSLGVWKPPCVPEFVKNLIVGKNKGVKRRCSQSENPVSYTHLTLPTNREV